MLAGRTTPDPALRNGRASSNPSGGMLAGRTLSFGPASGSVVAFQSLRRDASWSGYVCRPSHANEYRVQSLRRDASWSERAVASGGDVILLFQFLRRDGSWSDSAR